MMYVITMFSLDITVQERFYYSQVFTSLEVSFLTQRGYITFIGLIFSYLATVIPQIAIVQVPSEMTDHSITLGILHFIVTSIVQNDFPTNYAWWIGVGAGVLGLILVSEYISYQLQTMADKSNMGKKSTPKSLEDKKEEPPRSRRSVELKLPEDDDDDFDYIPKRLRTMSANKEEPQQPQPQPPPSEPKSKKDRRSLKFEFRKSKIVEAVAPPTVTIEVNNDITQV